MPPKKRGKHKMVDPVTLEVIHHRLESIANEMEEAMIKSAFSPIVKELRDGTAALFDAKGQTIAQAIALPGHLGMLRISVPTILKHFPVEQAQPGDFYIHNDPFEGGGHLPDITGVLPVFYESEVVALPVSMIHHADIGGITPGVATGATSRYQEGLTLPAVKFYAGGKPVKAIHDIIRRNVRTPDAIMGDIEAQVAASKVGEARLLELFNEYGKELMLAAMEQLLDHSEALTRHALEQLPDSTYSFTDYMDNDGVELDKRIKIQVAVTIKGSDLIADFTGSHPQTKGPQNCTPSAVLSCVAYVLKIITGGSAIPTNEGCFRPIKCILPEGSVVNPTDPAATGTRATTMQAIASALLGAVAELAPHYVNACSGGYGPLIYFGGTDPLMAKEYITNEIAMVGLGARPMKDGIDVICVDIGNVLNIPAEALELTSPLRVQEIMLHEDSGGAGEYRGGLGLKKSFKLLRGSCSATFRGERWYVPAWGLHGGLPSGCGAGYVRRTKGEVTDIPSKSDYLLEEGDEIGFISSGGGGYGDPLKRKPEAVLRDVLDGRVSMKVAVDDYGVVIDGKSMTIDLRETTKLRKEKAGKRGPINWTYDQGPFGRH